MSQQTRSLRTAYIVFALVFLTVVGGYAAGKQMALRDSARVSATAS